MGPSSDNNNNSAAMNLWQKFSDMQRSIEASRKERDDLQRQVDACQEEQQTLQRERRHERKRKRAADDEAAALDEKVAALQQQYQTVVLSARMEASLQKENALLQRERWKEYKAAVQQAFLEESREFRSTCKRLQVKAGMLGLRHAGIRAAVYAKGGEKEAAVYHGLDQVTGVTSNTEQEATGQTDPSTWRVSPDDDEMQEFLSLYSEKKSMFDAASSELENRNQQKQACVDKQESRSKRMEMLQKQLDRISKDNTDLESQIQDLNQLTEEANSMATGFSEGESWSMCEDCWVPARVSQQLFLYRPFESSQKCPTASPESFLLFLQLGDSIASPCCESHGNESSFFCIAQSVYPLFLNFYE